MARSLAHPYPRPNACAQMQDETSFCVHSYFAQMLMNVAYMQKATTSFCNPMCIDPNVLRPSVHVQIGMLCCTGAQACLQGHLHRALSFRTRRIRCSRHASHDNLRQAHPGQRLRNHPARARCCTRTQIQEGPRWVVPQPPNDRCIAVERAQRCD